MKIVHANYKKYNLMEYLHFEIKIHYVFIYFIIPHWSNKYWKDVQSYKINNNLFQKFFFQLKVSKIKNVNINEIITKC